MIAVLYNHGSPNKIHFCVSVSEICDTEQLNVNAERCDMYSSEILKV